MKKKLTAAVCSVVILLGYTSQPASANEYGADPLIQLIATDYGAYGDDNEDDYTAIQQALNEAYQKDSVQRTVFIPNGTYYISDTLKIHSDTILKLAPGAKIVRMNEQIPMIMNADDTEVLAGGYSHCKNITITGGEWNGRILDDTESAALFSINHSQNVTISDAYIHDYCGTHAVILNACSDVTAEDLTVSDYRDMAGKSKKSSWVQEAIHIDYTAETQSLVGWAAPLDNTCCRNIVIKNCTINNAAAGVGTHHDYIGLYENNITVTDCVFSNIRYACINGYGLRSLLISNNTATDCLSFAKLNKSQGEIKNNTAQLKGRAPTDVYGSAASASQITVKNSTVTISGNEFVNSTASGISVSGHSDVTAKNNKISRTKNHGIKAMSSSKVTSKSNEFSYCGGSGIYAASNAEMISDSDCVNRPSESGAYISSANEAILNNFTVKNSGNQGVYSKKSKTDISSSKIFGANGDGIAVISGSCNIKNSTVIKNEKRGIAVNKAKLTAKSNKVYSNGSADFQFSGTSGGTLKSNLIGSGGIISSAKLVRAKNTFRFCEATATPEQKAYKYTGKQVKAKFQVSFGGKLLRQNKDYKITYKNNVGKGKATATITGIGAYKGKLSKEFTIK